MPGYVGHIYTRPRVKQYTNGLYTVSIKNSEVQWSKTIDITRMDIRARVD